MPTAAFITLGCKVNQYETQVMREALKKAGYDIVAPEEIADVYVINTCTVTNISDRKSRQMIRKVSKLNPNATIVAVGCYAERKPDEVRNVGGVNLVLSNDEKLFIDRYLTDHRAVNLKSDFYPCITSFDEQSRAFIKIEDGCDSFCTYCIVPYVRGNTIRSRPLDSIVEEVRSLAKSGYMEVVLTGIHLGAYGRDFPDGTGLIHVLKTIQAVDGIERIRLSSIEPVDITDELISNISNLHKCAHHLHIPLQSGSDKILNLMNRGYASLEFETIVQKIRSSIPDAGISTDVMVGFPGETDSDFEETYNLAARTGFSRLHVFRYSPREGTPAAKFPDQVSDTVSSRRSQKMIALGHQLAQKFCSQMLGQEAEVLVEDKKKKTLTGLTSNYVRVYFNSDFADEPVGNLVRVKLIDVENDYLIGQRI